jgi:ADP-heptose:LPS heptosyltransferase
VALTGAVVVLRALGLGDLMTAIPALRGLRRALPDDRIVLCTPAWLEPLALASGAVDGVVDSRPLQRPRGRSVVRTALGVNLHGCGPESHRVVEDLHPGRAMAFAHPDVGWSREMPEWRAGEREVDRWCRLLTECGIPADPDDLYLEPTDAARDALLTVIHPGAASASRRWPAARFAEVARHELRRGRTVAITGSAAERDLAAAVADLAGTGADSVRTTSLPQLTGLLRRCGRIVCGDTGVAHLATALRTPSVLLFGPSPPSVWGPPPGRLHRVLWSGRPGNPHGSRVDPGLCAITAGDVIDALEALDDGGHHSSSASSTTAAPLPTFSTTR